MLDDTSLTTVRFMPVLSLQDAADRRNAIVDFVRSIMVNGSDYGIIPGTNKNVLLKPGAEKLNNFFGITPKFQLVESEKDWTGANHGGEPFFYFLYHCQLFRGEQLVAECDGLCNTMEKKFRYRNANRKCPKCDKETIIKGKVEYGGGWLCFSKTGGCGAKFTDADTSITSQQVGKVLNEDVADLVNTVAKQAQKRAYVGATLLAVNASEFFTQDMEDIVIGGEMVDGKTGEILTERPKPVPQPKPQADVERYPITIRCAEGQWQAFCDNPDFALIAGTPANPKKIADAINACGIEEINPDNIVQVGNTLKNKIAEMKANWHWAKDTAKLKAFWAAVKVHKISEQPITDKEVHEALGVEHLADYNGTGSQALAQVKAWAEKKNAEIPF